MDIGRGWSFLEHVLCSGFVGQWCPISASEDLKQSVIACVSVMDLLEEWLYEKIFQDLNKRLCLELGSYFNAAEQEGSDHSSMFKHAISHLHYNYLNRYLVALKRLQWIQLLAASAPASSMRDMGISSTSAFTPVKASAHYERDDGGRLQGPRKLNPLFCSFDEEDNKDKPSLRRHSVTFEKGTKGGLEENEKEGFCVLDGSYTGDKSIAEKLMFSDTSSQDMSFQDSQTSGFISSRNNLQGNFLNEDEDDIESFIRSPIGGNKKLMALSQSSSSGSTVKSLFFPPSDTPSFSGKQFMTNSSISAFPGLNKTSTPGFALHQTPGSITPIVQTDPTELSRTPSSQETLTIEMDRSQSKSLSPDDNLPDASTVFGVSIPSRPVPGLSKHWPKDDSENPQERVTTMMRAALLYSSSNVIFKSVKAFYSEGFALHKKSLDSYQSTDCSDSMTDQDRFDDINKQMEEMGLMERLSGSAVTEIVHTQIEKHISEECKGNFDASYMRELEQWLDQLVLGWLSRIHHCHSHKAGHASNVKAFGDRLYHYLYETYARSLIGQLFDIIIDFPDSRPAILDLCACLEKTDLRSELVATLKTALENRLLHPGVNTADILTAYIAAIKALRLLEPAGVILELVCEPVRKYLRSREDTVRCIVASLTDEGSNELISELVNIKPPEEEEDHDDSGGVNIWDNWVPDPVDADPAIVSKNRRSADILSILVNIYGSKELFVNEYRALLADRILMQYNYDEQRELRYLELLKLRFGEAQLHFCEVMLRDVTESRRINTRIQETKNIAEVKPDDIDMNAMILSAQFWPTFREEKITLPSELQTHLDKYTKNFEAQKQNRTLVWKPHLGIMNIELELKDETLNFSVSPVLAAIIMKFQEKSKWSVEELSTALEMTSTVVRRKMAFWQGQGLVREVTQDLYQLVEERRGRPQEMAVMLDEEEVESAMASAQQQKEEEMQVFWTYIQGMLANLVCLPLERIHSMLRMFGMEEAGSSDISLQELKAFLDNKVKDQVLVFTGGVYKLNKG